LDVVLGEPGEEQVVQPIFSSSPSGGARIIRDEEIRGAPDLVVEVISASTRERIGFSSAVSTPSMG
jgi:hypothetical protein